MAKAAGVSSATVSRVFSGAAKVDPATHKRVVQAAKKSGYVPNAYARTLSSGRSNTYGLILSDLTNPFFPDLVKSFQQRAREFGYETLISDTDYDLQRMEQSVRRMVEYKVDGVAIMTSEMSAPLLQVLRQRKIPMVFLDTGKPGLLVSNVSIDYEQGVDLAIQHLTSLGHRRIALIQGPAELRSAVLRREAFLHALKRHGVRPVLPHIRTSDHSVEGGKLAMLELLKQKPWPTAVMCSNDLSAIGALHAAHGEGIRVPQQLSIIGFDDIGTSSLMQPPLTTVRVSRTEVASRAFTALHAMTQGERTRGLSEVIPCDLVVRGSTASVKAQSFFR